LHVGKVGKGTNKLRRIADHVLDVHFLVAGVVIAECDLEAIMRLEAQEYLRLPYVHSLTIRPTPLALSKMRRVRTPPM